MAESKNRYIRPRDCKFGPADLPVIANLTSLGYNAAEIGMILGYAGKSLEGWKISAGKTLGEESREAINLGLQQADSFMVQELIKSATGYDWEEEKIVYKPVEYFNEETQEESVKMVPISKTVTIKHTPGNSRLAELLVTNRLPALFKRVSEIRKSSFEAKAELTETQIQGLIGRLLEAVGEPKRKIIESETV